MPSQTEVLANGPPGDDVTETEIVRAVTETRESNLLRAAVDSHSAQELSDQLGVPVEGCNRRIEKLTRLGLLEERDAESATTQDSAPAYSRCVSSVTFEFDGDELNVTVENRPSVKRKLDDVWRNRG